VPQPVGRPLRALDGDTTPEQNLASAAAIARLRGFADAGAAQRAFADPDR
jgi:hypothetical protein